VLECRLPVFTCFTTPWCHNCYPTCLFADQLVEEYDGSVKFVLVDIERNPELAEIYHVFAVPTILIFENSQEVNRLLGFQDRSSLRPLLDSLVTGRDNLIEKVSDDPNYVRKHL